MFSREVDVEMYRKNIENTYTDGPLPAEFQNTAKVDFDIKTMETF
jgi:hypothetical protein